LAVDDKKHNSNIQDILKDLITILEVDRLLMLDFNSITVIKMKETIRSKAIEEDQDYPAKVEGLKQLLNFTTLCFF